jgi:hypothetical protein
MARSPSSQSRSKVDDVPVEGPELPDVENVPAGYAAPDEARRYLCSDDATDPQR